MAIPTTRQEFSQFIMRKLGAPVLQINISEDQMDDIIDQSLYFFSENHVNGQIKTYVAHQLTTDDITNKYVTMPTNIIGAVRIFPIGIAMSSDALFNMRYQFVMNDLYSLTNVSLVPYWMTMQHISLLEEVLVGQQPVRYNRHENILHIDMDWSIMCAGMFLVIEAFMVIDPLVVPDVWRDRWLQDYCTALAKRQWGANLTKYNAILPSGLQVNGQKIYDDADKKVEEMEQKVIRDYGGVPAVFMA